MPIYRNAKAMCIENPLHSFAAPSGGAKVLDGKYVCAVCENEMEKRAYVCPSGSNHAGINVSVIEPITFTCGTCGREITENELLLQLSTPIDIFYIAGSQGRACISVETDKEDIAFMEIDDYVDGDYN